MAKFILELSDGIGMFDPEKNEEVFGITVNSRFEGFHPKAGDEIPFVELTQALQLGAAVTDYVKGLAKKGILNIRETNINIEPC
jgi:DNA-dependent RNA polymerase auxiliary subunit epsilon